MALTPPTAVDRGTKPATPFLTPTSAPQTKLVPATDTVAGPINIGFGNIVAMSSIGPKGDSNNSNITPPPPPIISRDLQLLEEGRSYTEQQLPVKTVSPANPAHLEYQPSLLDWAINPENRQNALLSLPTWILKRVVHHLAPKIELTSQSLAAFFAIVANATNTAPTNKTDLNQLYLLEVQLYQMAKPIYEDDELRPYFENAQLGYTIQINDMTTAPLKNHFKAANACS